MAKNKIQLGVGHQAFLYGCFSGVFFSGLGWWITHTFLGTQTDFQSISHTSEVWWLRLHGVMAMVALMAIGTVLSVHVPAAWRSRKNRLSGIFFLTVLLILSGTGVALYYVGLEALRAFLQKAHWVLGLAFPFLLVGHIVLGKRSIRGQKSR